MTIPEIALRIAEAENDQRWTQKEYFEDRVAYWTGVLERLIEENK